MAEDAAADSTFEIGKDGLGCIVVGIDGSSPSVHAGAWAAGLARRENASLVLVYVEPIASVAYWTPIGMAQASASAQELVDELRGEAARALDPAGIRWELVHTRGDPATRIEEVAAECRADCIVVGRSRHHGGLLGSVSKALLSAAGRPITVVP